MMSASRHFCDHSDDEVHRGGRDDAAVCVEERVEDRSDRGRRSAGEGMQ